MGLSVDTFYRIGKYRSHHLKKRWDRYRNSLSDCADRYTAVDKRVVGFLVFPRLWRGKVNLNQRYLPMPNYAARDVTAVLAVKRWIMVAIWARVEFPAGYKAIPPGAAMPVMTPRSAFQAIASNAQGAMLLVSTN